MARYEKEEEEVLDDLQHTTQGSAFFGHDQGPQDGFGWQGAWESNP